MIDILELCFTFYLGGLGGWVFTNFIRSLINFREKRKIVFIEDYRELLYVIIWPFIIFYFLYIIKKSR